MGCVSSPAFDDFAEIDVLGAGEASRAEAEGSPTDGFKGEGDAEDMAGDAGVGVKGAAAAGCDALDACASATGGSA